MAWYPGRCPGLRWIGLFFDIIGCGSAIQASLIAFALHDNSARTSAIMDIYWNIKLDTLTIKPFGNPYRAILPIQGNQTIHINEISLTEIPNSHNRQKVLPVSILQFCKRNLSTILLLTVEDCNRSLDGLGQIPNHLQAERMVALVVWT